MSENSKIEWCDHTFNPWEGCQKVGPGCDHCYAEARNARFGGGTAINWGPGAPRRRTSEANWKKPFVWNDNYVHFLSKHHRRQRVFCASLADVFDNEVPRQWRQELFDIILSTPHLDWLLLTKRIGNANRMLQDIAEQRGELMDANDRYRPLLNVWIGATIVDQAEAERDVPKLLAVPAARRFLSIEPLLGPVSFEGIFANDDPHDGTNALEALDWVIVGGESGPGARPMHPNWVRSLRDQCTATGVPFLFKQWGEFHPATDHDPKSHAQVLETACLHTDGSQEHRPAEAFALIGTPGWEVLCRVGKKTAGRLLDGVQHDGYPEVV